jgi:RNA polymerase sigma factor (sigma-70 family)
MTHFNLDRMTDENLCALVGREPGAEDFLFLRHIEPVTRFLMGRYQGIEHEAVAAEVLLDALEYVGRHGVTKSFRALLRRVANQYGWKAKQRADARGQYETPWDEARESGRAADDLERRVLEEVTLAQALQELTAAERAFLLLRYVDGLGEAEIARQSGKSVSAVKSSLYQARRKLRADRNLAEFHHHERKTTMQGWFLAGSHPQNYEIGVVREGTRTGKPSASLKSKGDVSEGFGTLMQMFGPDKYRGKRVRFSGQVKAESLARNAALWLRVDGPDQSKPLRFDNMTDRPIYGTSDWRRCEIVLDVPVESTDIAMGVLLAASGQVWVTDLQFEEVGLDVPTTSSEKEQPTEPQNLSFEA